MKLWKAFEMSLRNKFTTLDTFFLTSQVKTSGADIFSALDNFALYILSLYRNTVSLNYKRKKQHLMFSVDRETETER